jgi:tetratricopeptide (TPR) repeat protein
MKMLPCPPEHWEEFSELLDEAFTLPAAERAQWLRTLSAGYAHLKPFVERVLSADDAVRTSEYLEQPRLPTLPDSDATFTSGEPVGPYRLLDRLGEGGMGEVWSARRIDHSLERVVALKLPRAEFMTGAVRQRLLRERDILASLSHPHIALLYDAGVTAQGQPFLALELIDGQPIDSHCRQHRMGVEARVRLFLQVVEAVRFAHSRLVVHRDLKPSNIFVAKDGQVKLLDFGVAKLLDEHGGGGAGELTRVAGQAMTPEYAAPEQLAGEPVSVATDIFSLGVVLYELLTGQRPFLRERREEAPIASGRVKGEFTEACGMADTRALRKQLRGDLDAILACCLALEPAKRYASAEQLAQDLERHLKLEPIRARHVSRGERTWKFVRRNGLPVAMGVALLLALVIGMAGIFWQSRRAEASAEEARQQAHVAEERAAELKTVADFQSAQLSRMEIQDFGNDFLDGIRANVEQRLKDDPQADPKLLEAFDAMRPMARPADVARRTLGKHLLDPAKAEIAHRFADRPATRAALTTGLVKSYYDLELFSKVIEEVDTFTAAAPKAGEDTARMRLLRLQAMVTLGQSREAIEVGRPLVAELARNPGPQSAPYFQAKTALGISLINLADEKSVEEGFETMRAVADGIGASNPNPALHAQYLEARRVEGGALRALGRSQEAIVVYEALAKVLRPEAAKYGRLLPVVLMMECEARYMLHQSEAAPVCEEAVTLSVERYGIENPTTILARSHLYLQQRDQGQYAKSLETLETAYRDATRYADPKWENTQYLANAWGDALVDRGQFEKALPILQGAVEGYEGIAGEERHVGEARASVAFCLDYLGRADDARAEMAKAQKAVAGLEPEDPGAVYVLAADGILKIRQGLTQDALTAFREARDRSIKGAGAEDPSSLALGAQVALLEARLSPDKHTVASLKAQLENALQALGANSLDGYELQTQFATHFLARGAPTVACQMAGNAGSFFKAQFGAESPRTKRAQTVLGRCT